jgi:hypothetical protein
MTHWTMSNIALALLSFFPYSFGLTKSCQQRDFATESTVISIQSEVLGLGQQLLNGGAVPACAAAWWVLAHGLQLSSDLPQRLIG